LNTRCDFAGKIMGLEPNIVLIMPNIMWQVILKSIHEKFIAGTGLPELHVLICRIAR
jgi:hypothetical protein